MLDSKILIRLLTQVQEKHRLNLEQIEKFPDTDYYKPYVESQHYFDAIKDEVEESRKEDKKDNSVYLEDELWDILWDYMNLLYFLEKEGKISVESVTRRALKKYSERTQWLKDGISWEEIKKKQKIELQNEHNKKNGK